MASLEPPRGQHLESRHSAASVSSSQKNTIKGHVFFFFSVQFWRSLLPQTF